MTNKIISPIAIDMGAKNTGVYYAKYEQGSTFEQIEKHGEVLVYDKYTPLLRDRTAKRHARRGYQRKKLAKRLLVLVLNNYFSFPADKHFQAIGFLLNRRGFSFLEEQYSKEYLGKMPDDVWNALSDEVRNFLGDNKNEIADRLQELATNEPTKITKMLEVIQQIDGYRKFQKTKAEINKNLVYFSYVEKIRNQCDNPNTEEKPKDKNRLSKTSKWIVEKLIEKGVTSLKGTLANIKDNVYQINLLGHITQENSKSLEIELPDVANKIVTEKQKQTENNKSDWNFNISNFEFNDKNEKGLDDEKVSVHLHHLCYAVYKINDEIISGSRHRSKYFEEIKEDLDRFSSKEFLQNKHSPMYLKNFANEIAKNEKLDTVRLCKITSHISNLELKPLRAYFNDNTPIKKGKDHKNNPDNFISHRGNNGGDIFCLDKLSRLASTWFLRNWIVNAEKDNQEKVDSYKKQLRPEWKKHINKNNIIDFWLKTDPILTIPPYQSMNNRKPPKCQTLLLNGDYLDDKYPDWKKWLDLLNPDIGYKEKLQNLQSGKGKRKKHDGRLINDGLTKLRQLQFILDTAQKIDPFNLNKIWSVYHKLQKPNCNNKIQQEKLDKYIANSNLSDALKSNLKFKENGSFGHFINKYYQTRKKARGERYFLHQDRKDVWLTDGKLLTICPHKPRQKKHQWLIDLSAIVGVNTEQLQAKINAKNPEDWFKRITGFQSACTKAAKAQKYHRGALKTKIDYAQKINSSERNTEQKELNLLANNCNDKAKKLAKLLWQELSDDELLIKYKKFSSVFSFAQINNIVFKERSGFSKTCPVCSTDNGFRMQENEKGIAKASRLPAMSVRLIDGVVMRICDTISRHIANTKWDEMQDELKQGSELLIPLIMEQNRFEFEPSLAKIKGKAAQSLTDERDKEYDSKNNRIKENRICAYYGTDLGNDGEIDHIIPQASKYGTLNDEANLIYVSKLANQSKSNQTYYLGELNNIYKNKIFGSKTDAEIIKFIYNQLEGENAVIGEASEGDNFTFGKYLSFINLTKDQQIVFKHALFLLDSDPLKQKVINALQNRNRAIVNGTQRYLAQCIADKLYKKAKYINKENELKFDYFEYSARADKDNSTYNLRKYYQGKNAKLADDTSLADIAKAPNEKQKSQSHLIDAQMAFLLAADEHKNDGSMGLIFGEYESIWTGDINTKTGEFDPTKFFDLSFVADDRFKEIKLSRKKSKTGVRLHRSFHRPNFYAENYVPLFFGKKDNKIEIKAGFSWENSVKITTVKHEYILSILKFAKNKFIADAQIKTVDELFDKFDKKTNFDDFEVFYVDWDKTKIQIFLVDEFSTKNIVDGKSWTYEVTFLRKLSYRTQKETIKNFQDITDALNGIEIGKTKNKEYFSVKLFNKEVELPAKQEWKNMQKEWGKFNGEFNAFLKHYFCQEKATANTHQKVRKVYSLPVVNPLGHFLQMRQSWNGQDIYQISADSDSRVDGNKFSRLVLMKSGELKEVINEPFISKKIFKLTPKDTETNNDYRDIDPNKWYEIEEENDFPDGVKKIFYKIDNKTRPQVKIVLDNFNVACLDRVSIDKVNENATNKEKENAKAKNVKILENPLTKAKDNTSLDKKLRDDDVPNIVEYTASSFNKEILEKLLKSLIV